LVALDGLVESVSLNHSVATSHASAIKIGRDRCPVFAKAIAEFGESGPGQVGLGQLVEFACLKAGVNVPLGFGIWGDQLRKWNLEHSVDPFPLVRVV
jgi:hypothetical protein